MKVFKLLFLITVALFLIPVNTEAQLLKKINKRAQRAAEDVVAKKLVEKGEQEAEKALDSLLQIENKESSNAPTYGNLMIQNTEDLPLRDVYEFDTKVNYQMELESNGETSKMNYGLWFSKNNDYMGTELENPENDKSNTSGQAMSMITILDDENQIMVMLMEEQKIGQVMSMDQMKNVVEQENAVEQTNTDFNALKKTGKSKSILGYSCDEFTSENDGTKISLWISSDAKLFRKNMFYNLSKSLGGSTFKHIPSDAKGFMMEMDYENTISGDKSRMTVIDIQKKSKAIQTDDFQYMNISQFMPK